MATRQEEARKALQEMLDYLAEPPVRYCIINKVDRTGRPSATSTSAPSMRAGVRSARCGSIPTGAS